MKISAAFKACWHTYRTRFGQMLKTLLMEIVLRLMAFTPLLFLCAKETGLLALLCIPLYILIVLPARQNVAECMQDALSGGQMFSLRLVSFEQYGSKVLRGLRQALLLMLWGVLFIACTGLAVFIYAGKTIEGVTDVFTLLKTLIALGGGSSVKGAVIVLSIYAATLLPLLAGVAFHSGTRHAIALKDKTLVKGHRFGVMLVWLMGALTLLPFLAVVVWIGAGYLSALVSAIANLGSGSVSIPPVRDNLIALAAAALVLLAPAIPFKQLLSAAYVRELGKDKA